PLYKLQQYYYSPTDIIVLGDSRANHLSKESFDSIANEEITNLAYGAGTIEEIVETFWIVNEIHKLKKIYIGINFNLYNALNARNTVSEANELRKSKVSYITSKYCIKATFFILQSLITKKQIEIEKPPFSREEFWRHQLITSGPDFYKNYKYPSIYYENLREISEYCSAENIQLIFFIPPTHTDLQKKIEEYNLQKENEQFINDLSSLSTNVFDFNFENNMTEDKRYFDDPFHFNQAFEQIIIKVISSNKHNLITDNNVYKSLSR
ncbi:hypothetical protein, partial [Fulvivirga lutimaris]|uniref:hypothetical protein n=1 Tax=Fulvivirga lutimaris TaxID=1819566 RepID=UPI001623524C